MALAFGVLPVWPHRAAPLAQEGARATLSFVGASCLTLDFPAREIDEAPGAAVTRRPFIPPSLAMDDRWSGAGSLAPGVGGHFSGDRNRAEPQLFTPYATVRTPYAVTGARLGDPAAWRVTADRSVIAATAAHRIASPFRTAVTGPRNAWATGARHRVSLTLASPVAAGAAVSVSGPGGLSLSATFAADTPSPAVHVPLAGYVANGPKRAYVGLWLGVDGAGAPLATDGALSTATVWTLRDVETAEAVASGALTLAKAGGEPHRDGVNYNGCDVYAADFGSVTSPGVYRLEVAGIGASPAFPIAADAYAEPFRLLARWFFHQRTGCAIAEPYAEGHPRPRNGRPEDGLTVRRTNVLVGRTREGFGPASASIFPLLNAVTADTPVRGPNLAPGLWAFAEDTGHSAWLDAACRLRVARSDGLASETRLTFTRPLTRGRSYHVRMALGAVTGEAAGHLDAAGGGSSALFTDAQITAAASDTTLETTFTAAIAHTRFSIGKRGGADFEIRSLEIRELAANQLAPEAWGGWHDAGDWDTRPRHFEAIWNLADIIERFPSARTWFLNLPESGKPFAHADVLAKKRASDLGDGATVLPDLIHEALWGLSVWRRTQEPCGAVIGGVEYSSDGVNGSVSWNPIQQAYATGVEEYAAYGFARAAAKLGHVVRTVCGDATLGDALVAEAMAAWRWAQGVVDSGVDAQNTSLHLAPGRFMGPALERWAAAASLYRATGRADCRTIFEAHNPFEPQGLDLGIVKPVAIWPAMDYLAAGVEGRAVNAAVREAIRAWAVARGSDGPTGADWGLSMTGHYAWGAGWTRYGPGSNWPARRRYLPVAAGGQSLESIRGLTLSGWWFCFGCNPANLSLVNLPGLRSFADPLHADSFHAAGAVTPGTPVYGVAGGELPSWAVSQIGDALWPAQGGWPRYARIFETRRAVRCAEHDMSGNVIEMIFAAALARELGAGG
jgi:hypothetical protein